MHKCIVFGCSNCREGGFNMYSLPSGERNADRRRDWLRNIRRPDVFVPRAGCLNRTALVCEVHFESSQFEKYENDGRKKLKPNAVPTIFFANRSSVQRQMRTPQRRLTRRAIRPHMPNKGCRPDRRDHSYNCPSAQPTANVEPVSKQDAPLMSTAHDVLTPGAVVFLCLPAASSLSVQRHSSSSATLVTLPHHPRPKASTTTAIPLPIDVQQQQDATVTYNSPPSSAFAAMPLETARLKASELKRKLDLARTKCARLERESANLATNLQKFLNPDQVEAMLKRTTRGSSWSSDTLRDALELFLACGPKGYKLLLARGYPLPAVRALQNIICEANSSPATH